MVQHLGLADFLLVAQAALGVPAEVLALSANLHLADRALSAPAASVAGHDLYPGFAQKATVLCARLCADRPLPSGNLLVAYEVLREFVARNDRSWTDPSDDDGDETVKIIAGLASGRVSEAEFATWVAVRIGDVE
jgi:death-on-curing protein